MRSLKEKKPGIRYSLNLSHGELLFDTGELITYRKEQNKETTMISKYNARANIFYKTKRGIITLGVLLLYQ